MSHDVEPGTSGRAAALTWISAALGSAAVTANALSYLPFLEDDALISLRYARRLVDGHGLTWTDGERVEGYTNLLWVLATALLGALRIDLILAARILGCAGMSAAVLAIAARPSRSWSALAATLVGGFALAASGSIAAWGVGGLEQPLLAALLAWALVLLYPVLDMDEIPRRAILVPATLLGLLCLVRPDGALWTATAFAGLLWARGFSRKSLGSLLTLVAIPLLFFGGQLLFRRIYYQDWVPNTAYVKVAWTSARLKVGWKFLSEALLYNAPLVVAGLGAAGAGLFSRRAELRARVRLLLPPLLAWSVYVVVIGGGDTMPARRHAVPIVLLLALLVAEGAAALVEGAKRARLMLYVTAPLLLAGFAVLQYFDPRNIIARNARWEWDGLPIGTLLRTAFGDKHPLLAVDAAGCTPYFSGLPALDMLGLNDKHIARARPASFGEGKIGH
jgi:hypothetical protein